MRVDTMLKYRLPRNLENEAIKGQVGAAAQADFLGYLDIASEMPDPQAVLNGTHKEVPENPAVLYALCAALSAYATPKNSKHLMACLTLIPNKEFAAYCIKDAIGRNKDILKVKSVSDWFMTEGKKLLLG